MYVVPTLCPARRPLVLALGLTQASSLLASPSSVPHVRLGQ